MYDASNHPFVVWAACFLWLTSIFDIAWALLLFFCVGDMLLLTGTDLVNAIVLLSGIIMLPTNIHMLYSIAHNKKIDHKTKVVCCPLWLCITWIIFINCIGVILCVQRIYSCEEHTYKSFFKIMKGYRGIPKNKHLVDDLQWSLRCCGLKSYKDWFNKDWSDNRELELEPHKRETTKVVDSVPLSCCKTGSCMSNYLLELGPSSINTSGCGHLLYRIVIISMLAHTCLFITVVVVEVLVLKFIVSKKNTKCGKIKRNLNIHRIMSVNDNFDVSSRSYQVDADDSEDSVEPSPASQVKMDIYKEALCPGIYEETKGSLCS